MLYDAFGEEFRIMTDLAEFEYYGK